MPCHHQEPLAGLTRAYRAAKVGVVSNSAEAGIGASPAAIIGGIVEGLMHPNMQWAVLADPAEEYGSLRKGRMVYWQRQYSRICPVCEQRPQDHAVIGPPNSDLFMGLRAIGSEAMISSQLMPCLDSPIKSRW